MEKIFGKLLSYIRTAVLCWKWLQNLTIGLNMWEMMNVCGKRLK